MPLGAGASREGICSPDSPKLQATAAAAVWMVARARHTTACLGGSHSTSADLADNGELGAFSESLIAKPMIVVATKLDATTDRSRLEALRKFCKKRRLVFHSISAVAGEGVKSLVHSIADALDKIPRPAASAVHDEPPADSTKSNYSRVPEALPAIAKVDPSVRRSRAGRNS